MKSRAKTEVVGTSFAKGQTCGHRMVSRLPMVRGAKTLPWGRLESSDESFAGQKVQWLHDLDGQFLEGHGS